MSSRTREREYDDLGSVLSFALTERLKAINTLVPGVIVEYDRDKRWATVRSAFTTILTTGQRIPPPDVVDVPVLFPQTRGVSILMDLAVGDPVLLAFSQRGLANWLEGYEETDPDVSQILAYGECIAIPGFGLHPGAEEPWAGRPQDDAPFVLQRNTEDGGYISLRDKTGGGVEVHIEGDLTVSGSYPTAGSLILISNLDGTDNTIGRTITLTAEQMAAYRQLEIIFAVGTQMRSGHLTLATLGTYSGVTSYHIDGGTNGDWNSTNRTLTLSGGTIILVTLIA